MQHIKWHSRKREMANEHVFALKHVRNVLNLIIQGKFINYRKTRIFREGGSESAKKALEAFLAKVNWKQDEAALIKATREFVAKYNQEYKGLPIDDYVWADVAKQCFQNGRILNKKSVDAYTAWYSFLRQLKSIQPHIENIPLAIDGTPLYDLKPEIFQMIMPQFISQLSNSDSNSDDRRSAEVIHNYMHLTFLIHQGSLSAKPEEKESNPLAKDKQRAVEHNEAYSKGNTFDIKAIGLMMNPSLLDGLELSNMLSEKTNLMRAAEPSQAEYERIRKLKLLQSEYEYFGRVLELILCHPHPLFNEPYSSKFYRRPDIKQAVFEEESVAFVNFLWEELPTSNLALKEVHVTVTERAVQSTVEELVEPAAAGSEKQKHSLTSGIKALILGDRHDNQSPRKSDQSPKKSMELGSPNKEKKESPKADASSPPSRTSLAAPRRPSPKDRSSIDPRPEPKGPLIRREISVGRLPTDETKQVSFARTPSYRELVSPRQQGQVELAAPTFLPGYMVALVPVNNDGSSTPRPSSGVTYIMQTAPISVPSARSSTDATTGIVLTTELEEARKDTPVALRRKGT